MMQKKTLRIVFYALRMSMDRALTRSLRARTYVRSMQTVFPSSTNSSCAGYFHMMSPKQIQRYSKDYGHLIVKY